MTTTVEFEPEERTLSAIDLFCMQTDPSARVAAAQSGMRSRAAANGVAVLSLLLVVALGYVLWWAHSLEQDRDALVLQLASERAARIEAQLSIKQTELRLASYALETRVRRDLVDGRMSDQERRAVELEQEAARVRLAKLVEADCVTPRSVMKSASL